MTNPINARARHVASLYRVPGSTGYEVNKDVSPGFKSQMDQLAALLRDLPSDVSPVDVALLILHAVVLTSHLGEQELGISYDTARSLAINNYIQLLAAVVLGEPV